MSAAVLVEGTQGGASEGRVVPTVAAQSAVLVGHDVDRERQLDVVAANIEGAAEGLAVFLLLALFGIAFVVATLTGVFA